MAVVTALAVAGLVPGIAAARSSVQQERIIVHHEIKSEYFPDDICGPRAGWTTFDVTWRFMITNLGDSFHVTYGETGTYETDLDDPSLEDYSGQFTDAYSVNLTRGGTFVMTDSFHDHFGSVRIKVRVVLVDVGGEVTVNRDILEVTGCP